MTKGQKIFLGVGLGCVGILVLSFAGCMALGLWLQSHGIGVDSGASTVSSKRENRQMMVFGDVHWRDIKVGDEFSLKDYAYGWAEPNLPANSAGGKRIEAGEALTVRDKRVCEDDVLGNSYWIQVEIYEVSLRKGQVRGREWFLWMESPSLKRYRK